MQHSMIWVGLGLLPGNHTRPARLDDLNRLAGFLGAMAQSNADQGPEVVPPLADRRPPSTWAGESPRPPPAGTTRRRPRRGDRMTVALESADQAAVESVVATLQLYFDGLHHSDTERLARVFHPQAIYASATDGVLVHMTMGEYLPMVDARPSPRREASRVPTVSRRSTSPVP